MAPWWRGSDSFSELISASPRTLRAVIGLHLLESAAQMLALGIAVLAGVTLPVTPLFLIACAFLLWNAASWLQTRSLAAETECQGRILLQLTVATTTLAAMLYFTGGATSPLVSLFLIPIAIGALSLRIPGALLLAGFAAGAYTLLLFFHVPLAAQHVHGEAGFNFHVIGMWLNFLGSAVVLLVFLGLLAAVTRERAGSLAALRERQLRSEQLVAMAGVAAGAAHALATPLSTLTVLLDEMETSGQSRADIDLAREQLTVVKSRLDEILRSTHVSAGSPDIEPETESVQPLLNRIVRQWHARRPECDLRVENSLPDIAAVVDPAIGHGLVTLLDNGADANGVIGETRLVLRTLLRQHLLVLEVEDQGNGPLPAVHSVPRSDKPQGHGAGLMILRTNLERLEGRLDFFRGERGCVARLEVPLLVTAT
ncbi:MAG: hypothetical protein FJ194_15040 [Gammaproteobacteria bacterium]|nr:hypothetical protein [Gammaproteobacteria bacterium]